MGKILVVDDELSIRDTLCEFLTRQGHSADNAGTAAEALQMIGYMNYDVIISDIVMPKLSGLQLVEQIRSLEKKAQIIIMTGEPTVDSAVQSVQYGANDYLIKPIRKDVFLSAVEQAMRVKMLNDAKEMLEQHNLDYQRDLERMVELRTAELSKNMTGIVFLLSAVTEVRDPYGAGHQRRVGNLSAAIAKIMGFSENEIENIRISGYMHDIGKIMIPTEILAKPGLLNPIEREIVQNHPHNAFEMLFRVNLPKQIAHSISQHHERYDGTGYPNHLQMDHIVIESQILAVADVVEAMSAHRPYRPAHAIEDALAEVERLSGKGFHPDVVAACLKLFRSEHYILDESEHEIVFHP